MRYAAVAYLVIYAILAFPVAAQEAMTSQLEAPGKGGVVLDVQPTASESAKHLAVAVEPDGQRPAVTGAVDVVGFPFIENGAWSDVDWEVNGSQITGTLKRKNGAVEGTFDGTITTTGVSGKFTHVDGRVGLWSWDGPSPAPQANGE